MPKPFEPTPPHIPRREKPVPLPPYASLEKEQEHYRLITTLEDRVLDAKSLDAMSPREILILAEYSNYSPVLEFLAENADAVERLLLLFVLGGFNDEKVDRSSSLPLEELRMKLGTSSGVARRVLEAMSRIKQPPQ